MGRPLLEKNHIWLICFNEMVRGRSKRHCNIEKDFMRARWPLLAKNCHMILCIVSNMLSQHVIKSIVLHRFHWRRATIGTILVDLHWNMSTPFITADVLWIIDQKKASSLCPLCWWQMVFQTWRGGRRNFMLTFVKDGLLESILSRNPFSTKLGQVLHERNDLTPLPPY